VGKYIELKDSYKSIVESFNHAGAALECKVNIEWIHSEKVTNENAASFLDGLDAVLVAPGFGSRGIEGKIQTIKHVRENNIPFFGICLGMQCAVIEFSRHVLNMEGANSTEIDDKSEYPVIDLMEDQKTVTSKGGTMRLGAYTCKLKEGSHAYKTYNESIIRERHRHRYEFNNKYLEQIEKAGLKATGINPESKLVEIMELEKHPYFVGVQFHPEYKSTVANPAPLFKSFIKAAIDKKARS